MSLLLDALKKSHEGKDSGAKPALELTLEDHPAALPATMPEAAPAESGTAALPPQAQPRQAQIKSEPAREAGKSLFGAKKKPKPAKGNMRLGIVPIALIAGTLFGSGYGYYVWREIQPRPLAVRTTPPPAPPVATPAATYVPAAPTAAIAPPPPLAPQPALPTATPEATAGPVARPAPRRVRPRAGERLVIERQPQVDTLTPLLQRAYQEYRSGDYPEAARDYHQALRQSPQNRDALLGLAAVAQAEGQDAAAAQYYGQVLALDPRDPLANAVMSSLGKSSGASRESHLKLLVEQQPQSAALHFALGNLYADQSRWGEAQQAYFDAYSLQPDAAQFAYNLAISLDHLGQRKQAAQYYRRALQLDAHGGSSFDHAQAEQRLQELKLPQE